MVDPARREFLAQVEYYEQEEPGLGSRFAAQVEEATLRALAFPLSVPSASKNTRRVFVRNFPFSIVYRAENEGILVFAAAHHAFADRGIGVRGNLAARLPELDCSP